MSAASDVSINPSSAPLLISSASRRLLRDCRELERDPIPTVSARPLSTDLFTWHANLFPPSDSPYSSCIFHVILKFPQDYPNSPPRAQLCTAMPHPNVFEGWDAYGDGYPYICLDLLKSESKSERYVGWSTAYSVSTILMQLAAFLFDATVPQYYGTVRNQPRTNDETRIQKAITRAQRFECKEAECGHRMDRPQPPKPQFHHRTSGQTNETQEKKQDSTTKTFGSGLISTITRCYWDGLNEPMTRYVFSFLSPSELRSSTTTVCHHFIYVIRSFRLLVLNHVTCFHRRVTLDADPRELFGFGFNLEFHPARYGKPTELKSVTPVLDVLSYSAFVTDRVRMGIWKEPFTHFVPIAINQNHFARSERVFESSISRLATYTDDSAVSFTPDLALNVVTNIMNSMVVQLMETATNGLESVEAYTKQGYPTRKFEGVPIFQSEKSMLGFCSFHHLLIALAIKYPSIQISVNRRIREFLSTPKSRHKDQTPNLGQFICFLSISDCSWDDIAIPLLKETFTRNVRWLLQKQPELAEVARPEKKPGTCWRLRQTFQGCLTSMRLLMFQYTFIKMCRKGIDRRRNAGNSNSALVRPSTVRPAAASTGSYSDGFTVVSCRPRVNLASVSRVNEFQFPIRQVFNSYNSRLGRPQPGMAHALQQATKQILSINDFDHMFDYLHISRMRPDALQALLERCVLDSETSKYHNRYHVERSRFTPDMQRCACARIDGRKIIMNGQYACRYGAGNADAYDQQLGYEWKDEEEEEEIKRMMSLENATKTAITDSTTTGPTSSSSCPSSSAASAPTIAAIGPTAFAINKTGANSRSGNTNDSNRSGSGNVSVTDPNAMEVDTNPNGSASSINQANSNPSPSGSPASIPIITPTPALGAAVATAPNGSAAPGVELSSATPSPSQSQLVAGQTRTRRGFHSEPAVRFTDADFPPLGAAVPVAASASASSTPSGLTVRTPRRPRSPQRHHPHHRSPETAASNNEQTDRSAAHARDQRGSVSGVVAVPGAAAVAGAGASGASGSSSTSPSSSNRFSVFLDGNEKEELVESKEESTAASLKARGNKKLKPTIIFAVWGGVKVTILPPSKPKKK